MIKEKWFVINSCMMFSYYLVYALCTLDNTMGYNVHTVLGLCRAEAAMGSVQAVFCEIVLVLPGAADTALPADVALLGIAV